MVGFVFLKVGFSVCLGLFRVGLGSMYIGLV